MNNKALIPVFALTLFLSAFLIFSVQPMASKMLLPLLGGSPSVWNTAMVFFQAMLLAGYGYAHAMAKYFSLRTQAIIHIILLCLFTLVLPMGLPTGIHPPEDGGQSLWQIGVMLSSVGGPFFVLAASAPLFQHWFASTTHKDAQNPYFLYAVSNAGSMISLLSYPVLIEPFLGLSAQTVTWHMGYILLIVFTMICAYCVWNAKKAVQEFSASISQTFGWRERGIWIFLAAVPSSLMLGVTTFITTDLASAPFLWVLPLAIYLATFIIAFARRPIISNSALQVLTPYFIVFVVLSFLLSSFVALKFAVVILHLLTFFFCALLCHSELARKKPDASHLTEYFLWISVGGVVGGIFNALIAPNVFLAPLEYGLALSAIGFIIWAANAKGPFISKTFNIIDDKNKYKRVFIVDFMIVAAAAGAFTFILMSGNGFVQLVGSLGIFFFLIFMIQNKPVFAICTFLALMMFQSSTWNTQKKLVMIDRNYFGVLRVYAQENIHFFYHGTTIHGAQIQDKGEHLTPVTYYSPGGPASDVFNATKGMDVQRVAGLGLGVGSIACFKNKGRSFDFYEIDPDVVRVAEDKKYFSFLSECGSPYKNIIGDARLKIEQAPDDYYQMIFIDTFSSDNIPVHIMTKEAFILYLRKLSPDGIITMNISNRFLDLRPVLKSIADDLGLTIYFKNHSPVQDGTKASKLYTTSFFAVLAENPILLAPFVEEYQWKPLPQDTKAVKPWTDDYANILGSLYSFK